MPTMTFDECPEDLDVLVVGMVPPEIVEDTETLAFFAILVVKRAMLLVHVMAL